MKTRKHSFKNYFNRELHSNLNLNLPIVASTYSCKVKESQTSPRYHFTALKSSALIGFSTLPYESANVVALYRANVVAWQRSNVAPRHRSKAPYRTNHALTPEPIRAGKLEAGSWNASCKLLNQILT